MRLAVLNCPAIWNIGNSFIVEGARIIIDKFKKNYEEVIELESLESGNLNLKYRTDFISMYGDAILSSLTEEDTLVVVGGSCLSRYMIGMFDQIISRYSCKKILIGAGFYENLPMEGYMYQDLPNSFDAIFTRDHKTWEILSQKGKFKNVHEGIDLAFWLGENKKFLLPEVTDFSRKYSAINIDSPEVFDLQKKLYYETSNAILSWNNPSKIGVFNAEPYKAFRKFVGESYYGYIRFYGKADFVHTNRIHTFLICILFSVPCKLFISKHKEYHRYYLFHGLGLDIEYGKTYTQSDYDKVLTKLKPKKAKFIQDLKLYL